MLWNIFLVLCSVLNTYSSPINTLFKTIQHTVDTKCPVLQNMTLSSRDYLKPCFVPSDPNTSDIQVIRCNLYFNQFKLLCAIVPPDLPPMSLSPDNIERSLLSDNAKNLLSNTCKSFAKPLMTNNSTNIDDIVVKKCEIICTDLRTDNIDKLCLASYFMREIVIYIQDRLPAIRDMQNTHPDISGNSDILAPQSQQVSDNAAPFGNAAPLAETIQEPISKKNAEKISLPNQSGNADKSVTNDNQDTSPQLTVPVDSDSVVNSKNEIVSHNVIEEVVSKTNGNVAESETKPQTSTLDHEKIPINAKENSNKEIVESVPKPVDLIPVVESKSTEKAATSQQVVISNKSTTLDKNDITETDDGNLQNMAQASDYTDGKENGADLENNRDESDNHMSNVKSPRITEDTEANLIRNPFNDSDKIVDDDSYFFTYFMMLCVVFIFAYVGYHNKQKIIAIVVEGRRGSSGGGRGGRSRGGRRPNSANYHKLDSNLEEAVSSNTTNKTTSKVIY